MVCRFRWVDCQLESLRKCLSPAAVRTTLHQLPKSLDETYARILRNIPDEYFFEAHQILQLLVASYRPLSLIEVAEAIAVDCDHEIIDLNRKLRDEHDILEICSTLITKSNYTYTDRHKYKDITIEALHFSHYSVKEYLISSRISIGHSARFAVTNSVADQLFAKICLIYLLQTINEPTSVKREELLRRYPLMEYAADYWSPHFIHGQQEGCRAPDLSNLSVKIFQPVYRRCFLNWRLIFDPHRLRTPIFDAYPSSNPHHCHLIYYSSRLGLLEATEWLLIDGAAPISRLEGGLERALQVAVERNDAEMVKLLVEKGMACDLQGFGLT